MYGLDQNVKLDFLVGRRVEQICIGEFQCQMRFDEDVIISAEGSLTIDGRRYDDPRSMSAPLASLLGIRVSSAASPGTGDLALTMANGLVVVVHDSKQDHESYTVTWKGGTLVV